MYHQKIDTVDTVFFIVILLLYRIDCFNVILRSIYEIMDITLVSKNKNRRNSAILICFLFPKFQLDDIVIQCQSQR